MVAIPKRWLIGWIVFSVSWSVVFFYGTLIAGMACDGDGGEPYAAPASPLGHYCAAADHVYGSNIFLLWGLAPILVVAAGTLALAFGRRRVALAVAVAAVGLIVAHVSLSLALPNTCTPDDETVAGCSHY